jgi:hypothetical protein
LRFIPGGSTLGRQRSAGRNTTSAPCFEAGVRTSIKWRFSVELNEIAHASVVRNWRGKPREILLRGGGDDLFRIEISDVAATADFNTADGKPAPLLRFLRHEE